MAEEEQATTPEKRVSIGKIYIKDFSFESPQSPLVFRKEDWNPKTNLNLRSTNTPLDDDYNEVVLTITIEAKDSDGDKTLFLVELQQAGLFEIKGYDNEELGALVGSFCPNVLFPYARESIASIVQKGGFPEFVLQPLNFDALYAQSLKEKQAQAQVQAAPQESH